MQLFASFVGPKLTLVGIGQVIESLQLEDPETTKSAQSFNDWCTVVCTACSLRTSSMLSVLVLLVDTSKCRWRHKFCPFGFGPPWPRQKKAASGTCPRAKWPLVLPSSLLSLMAIFHCFPKNCLKFEVIGSGSYKLLDVRWRWSEREREIQHTGDAAYVF